MTLALPHLPIDQGEIVSTADLLDSGHTRSSLAAAERSGRLKRVRCGYFWVLPLEASDLDPAAEHRAHIVAALRDALGRGRELVLAGPSAAIWLELPWIGRAPPLVTIAAPHAARAGSRSLVRPIGDVADEGVVRHRGALITSPARTVIDTARLAPSPTGLAVADAALHAELTYPAELADLLMTACGRKGAARARWCVTHADGLSESPGESLSRHAMIRAGLPMPLLQVEFTLPDGRTVRVDFYWDGVRLVGEFDGLSKYRRDPAGRDSADVVIDEKWREDGLRAMGKNVIRWGWRDVWAGTALIARLRALLE